jgi:dihydroxyacetone kinase
LLLLIQPKYNLVILCYSVLCNVSAVSYGVAVGLCAVPGTNPADRLAANDVIEVGLGIHAEAGQVRKINPTSVQLSVETVRHMVNKMLGTLPGALGGEAEALPDRLGTSPGEQVAVLLNNLGGISELELLVVIRDLLVELQLRKVQVVRCYIGSFMTSLEMAGFSVTLLKVEGNRQTSLLPALDFPTSVNIWRASPLLGEGIVPKVRMYTVLEGF